MMDKNNFSIVSFVPEKNPRYTDIWEYFFYFGRGYSLNIRSFRVSGPAMPVYFYGGVYNEFAKQKRSTGKRVDERTKNGPVSCRIDG